MIRPKSWAILATVACTIPLTAGLGAAGPAAAAPAGEALAHRNIPVCPTPPAGYAHCHAIVHQAVTAAGQPAANASSPTGISPDTYMQAYGWGTSTTSRVIGDGTGQTIAVVDAYDDPTIVSDFNTFSSTFVPCTGTCSFVKVNQNGGTSYPRANSGWALEIALDVEWAHAIAPAAKILLVEASSNSFSNLMAAEDYAGAHAQYVTNSWGGNEFSSESGYDSHFSHSGTSFFASSGDTGGVVEYPAASPNVIAVGGTTLSQNATTWTETGWSSSGGGCSAYEAANASQSTGSVNCHGDKGTPDVASDADPNSGVDVYDTTSYYGQSGWFVVGGTSAASPVWAARAADQATAVGAAYVYGQNITYRDITSGNNGYPAGPGYDLVTGLGSWINGSTNTTVGAPTGLTANVSGTSVDLTWTASSTSGVTYDVYRSNTSGAELTGTPIATGVTTPSYTDSPGNGTWYYEVTATTGSATSSPSNEASATVGTTTTPATITSSSCAQATCSFTGTGSGTLTWYFNYPQSSPSAIGTSVSYTYTSAGSYTVELQDGAGHTATTPISCKVVGHGKNAHLTCG